MFPTNKSILQLVSLFKSHNVKRFVISAGSRHKQIEIALGIDPFFEIYSVVDERSASFFALGLIQSYNEPVGIICTSGTASTNYYSAISEAFYQHLPLLVITTDKPPRLLDQQEDQMIQQVNMYGSMVKYSTNLPEIKTPIDEWHLNRLVNEALLELNHHGQGPVHINIPIKSYEDTYEIKELPHCRVIKRFDYSTNSIQRTMIADTLSGKKIIFVLGEGQPMNDSQYDTLDLFIKKFDCVFLADKMSNCHHQNVLENALPLLLALSNADIEEVKPDLIITCRSNYTFNDIFKGFVKRCGDNIEHWYVSPSGKIVDPFRTLGVVFEMNEFDFMSQMIKSTEENARSFDFSKTWRLISNSISEPNLGFCHITAIGKLLRSLPKGSCVQLANSHTVRMAQFFDIDSSVKVFCNRGTDGIDGSMSTSVGYAASSENLVYLLIGDLSFFYDMNALWNIHLSNKIRILLVNNFGGSILSVPKCHYPDSSKLPNYIKARHSVSAKAWLEDRGFKYFSASNTEELDYGIVALTNENSDYPICLEVFSDNENDYKLVSTYYGLIRRKTLEDKLKTAAANVYKKVMRVFSNLMD